MKLIDFRGEGLQAVKAQKNLEQMVENSEERTTALAAHEVIKEWLFAHQCVVLSRLEKYSQVLELFHEDLVHGYLRFLLSDGKEERGSSDLDPKEDFDKPIPPGRKRSRSLPGYAAEKRQRLQVKVEKAKKAEIKAAKKNSSKTLESRKKVQKPKALFSKARKIRNKKVLSAAFITNSPPSSSPEREPIRSRSVKKPVKETL